METEKCAAGAGHGATAVASPVVRLTFELIGFRRARVWGEIAKRGVFNGRLPQARQYVFDCGNNPSHTGGLEDSEDVVGEAFLTNLRRSARFHAARHIPD